MCRSVEQLDGNGMTALTCVLAISCKEAGLIFDKKFFIVPSS